MQNPRTQKSVESSKRFIGIMLFTLIVFGIYMVSDYIAAIIFAIIIGVMFRQMHLRIQRVLKGRAWLATPTTGFIITLIVLIPALIVLSATLNQVLGFQNDITNIRNNGSLTITALTEDANKFLSDLPIDNIRITEQEVEDALASTSQILASFFLRSAVQAGSSALVLITQLLVFYSVLGSVLNKWPEIIDYVKKISPMPPSIDDLYLERVIAMSKSMLRGIFIIAIIQGVSTGIALWITGVDYAFFWAVVATIFSIIPLGAGFISIPIGLILLVLGQTWQGIFLIAFAVIVVSNIDNVLRPKLAPKEANLNELLTLIGILGGLSLFGFAGIIYGPVIMIIIFTTVEVYVKHYKGV